MNRGTNIELGFYDDRIEIVNFGGISYDQTMEELLKNPKSSRRNQLICDIFSRLNYMERRGSGIEKIMEAYKNDKLMPKFEGNQHSFILTFYSRLYRDVTTNVTTNVITNVTTNDIDDKIIECINQRSNVTIAEMSKIIGVTTRTIQRSLNTLKEQGVITRVGSTKKGYWKIIE